MNRVIALLALVGMLVASMYYFRSVAKNRELTARLRAEESRSLAAEAQAIARSAQPPAATPSAPVISDAGAIRFGTPAPKPRTPGTIRIAAYNLANLFDAIDDPALQGDMEDIDDAKPVSEQAAIADTIRAMDADVVSLCEIESEAALKAFMEEHLAGAGYDYVISLDAGDPRGIEQAIISKFPIENPRQWIHAPLPKSDASSADDMIMHRSPLAVDVVVPAGNTGAEAPYRFTIYAVHFKSGRDFSAWRDAESNKLIELIKSDEAAKPGTNIVVMGDLNSMTDQPGAANLLASGLADGVPAQNRDPLTTTHESGRRIDYILFNASMKPEIVEGSGFVLGTPARPAGADWRTTPAPAGYASDHYPVAIDLKPVEIH